jgi:hypothetical protein
MNRIQNLYKVRRDGKIIKEEMTFEQIDALGEISKVVEVHWTDGNTGRSASAKSKFGTFAEIVQGRRFVAVLVYKNETDCNLVVFNPDGSTHLVIPNIQTINGEKMTGSFGWFESPHHPADSVFGVVFQADHRSSAQYWMDLDANTGEVLACTWTK